MNDAEASVVVTADGGYRRGAVVPLKANVDEALGAVPSVRHVVVVRRTGQPVPMQAGRDRWWDELMAGASPECAPEPVDSEHPLFILYTRARPEAKGHRPHRRLPRARTRREWVFDLKDEDEYWCTADIGWVTGHSYVVYGILANGATTVMYEGAPNHPNPDRCWEIIDQLGVTIFYTAPTAIRAFVKWGEEWPRKHELSTLRLLGTVGEPINPERDVGTTAGVIGRSAARSSTLVADRDGRHHDRAIPGAIPTKPGSGRWPLPGIVPEVRTRDGTTLGDNQGGYLVITRPCPACSARLPRPPSATGSSTGARLPVVYFTGDGRRRDADGYIPG